MRRSISTAVLGTILGLGTIASTPVVQADSNSVAPTNVMLVSPLAQIENNFESDDLYIYPGISDPLSYKIDITKNGHAAESNDVDVTWGPSPNAQPLGLSGGSASYGFPKGTPLPDNRNVYFGLTFHTAGVFNVSVTVYDALTGQTVGQDQRVIDVVTTTNITGTVSYPDGTPVQGTIPLHSLTTPVAEDILLITDSSGHFTAYIPPGAYYTYEVFFTDRSPYLSLMDQQQTVNVDNSTTTLSLQIPWSGFVDITEGDFPNIEATIVPIHDGQLDYSHSFGGIRNGVLRLPVGQYALLDWNNVLNQIPFTVSAGQHVTVNAATLEDNTPPVTTASTDIPPNANGWYNKNVTVTLKASDSGSGVRLTLYSVDNGQTWKEYNAPFIVSAEGKDTIMYRSTDNAGNLEVAKSLSIPLDKTPPSTQSSTSGKQGSNGWYVGPVQLSLSATDNESGVTATYYSTDGGTTWQTYTSPMSFSSDGKYSIEYYSVDNAGNKETPHAVSFSIDQTPPTISVSSPISGSYLDDQSLTVTYLAVDSMSGADNSSVNAMLDGQPISSGSTIALYTLSLGSHTFTVSAADNAGNTATQSVMFQVGTSVDSLKNLVSQFTSNRSIDDGGISNALTAKLDSGSLQAFVNQVEAQSGKHISSSAVKYLLRDADFLVGQ